MLTGHGDTLLSRFLDSANAPSEFPDLSRADFLAPVQQTVFDAIVDVYHAGAPVNVLSVTDRLRAKGQLKNVGGESWHGNLPKFVNPAMARYAHDQLRDTAAERKAKEIGRDLEKGSLDPATAANQLLELASQGDSISNLLDELDKRRFDAEKPPPAAQPLFKLLDSSICTAGNLTGVQAQAKGGKTGLVSAIIAAPFPDPKGDCLGITSDNPQGYAVIHFDTEQSPSDHHKVLLTALRRAGAKSAPKWLRSYALADLPSAKRRKAIVLEMKRAKKEYGGILVVILDGGADLLNDPNDSAEAFGFVDELHQLAIQYSTSIVAIIHENPGSEIGKTRGHFGSQLERKAETNLRLSKDKDDGVTTIFSEKSRHAHIPKALGPRFVWSEDEQMHVTAGPRAPAHRPKKFDPGEIIEIMDGRELGRLEVFELCEERGWKFTTFRNAWADLKERGVISETPLNHEKWRVNDP